MDLSAFQASLREAANEHIEASQGLAELWDAKANGLFTNFGKPECSQIEEFTCIVHAEISRMIAKTTRLEGGGP